MKKIAALASIALTLLATPALAARHHQQNNAAYGQADPGYYDPSHVRPGDVPFAPF